MRHLVTGLLCLFALPAVAATHPDLAPFPVCSNNACGLLDRSARWVIKPSVGLQSILPNGAGWRTTSAGGLIGMLEANGEELFAPRFEELDPYVEALAPAQLPGDDLKGYVDWRGKWVIAPQFAYATPFVGKLARVQKPGKAGGDDGAWGRIDRSGRWVDTQDNPSAWGTDHSPPLPAWAKDWGSDWWLQRGFATQQTIATGPVDVVVASSNLETRFLDLHGKLIARIIKNGSCEHVDQIRNAAGDVIWPEQPEAECWLAAHPSSDEEAPAALRPQLARLRAENLRHSAQADRERRKISRGAPFPFLRYHPLYREIEQAWREAPLQQGPLIVLGDGVSLELPPGLHYLPPAEVRKLSARLDEINARFQEAMRQAQSAPAASPKPKRPAAKAKEDDAPDIAWIIAPDRRWQASLYRLPTGHVNLNEHFNPQQMLENARLRRYFTMNSEQIGESSWQSATLKWVVPPHVDREINAFTHGESRRTGSGEVASLLWLVPGRSESMVIEVNWSGLQSSYKIKYYADEIRALAAAIRFAPGHRHADRQPDDPAPRINVARAFEGPPSKEYVEFSEGVSRMLERDEKERAERRADMWQYILMVCGALLFAAFSKRGR